MTLIGYIALTWFGLIVLCVLIGLGYTVYSSIREATGER